MNHNQSPIFTKTYDFLLWLLNHTANYPKSERFRMAKRLEDTAFSFYERLIQAARSSRSRTVLLEADIELDKLRLFVRLSYARKLMTQAQYGYASEHLVEIGRLLGGWLNTIPDRKTVV